MKKILLLIIILIITGCTSQITVPEITENGKIIDDDILRKVNIHLMDKEYIDDHFFSDEWNVFIKNKYNLDINFFTGRNETGLSSIVIGNYTNDLFMAHYQHAITLNNLIDTGMVQSFNEILKDNDTWHKLPVYIKEAYTDHEGNIWALPSKYNIALLARLYDKEVIDSLKIELPETLDEMFEVFNKIYNATRIPALGHHLYKPYNLSYGFEDIFAANGIYKCRGEGTVQYNIKTGTFEDGLLHPNIIDTLNYVKTLLQSNLVYKSDRISSDMIINKEAASFCTHISFDDRFYRVLGIKGKEDEFFINPAYTRGNHMPFLLPNNPDIDKIAISRFVNTFYDLNEGYIYGRYGVTGYTYEEDNSIIHIKKEIMDEDKNIINNPLINLNIEIDKRVLYDDNSLVNDINILILNEIENSKFKEIIFFKKPIYKNPDNSFGFVYGGTIIGKFIELYDSITPEELIKEYKSEMQKMNYQEILDLANERIGKATVYKY